jgi:hypothetical protein
MNIKTAIDKMLEELPSEIPDLLDANQAALVQSCLITLKGLAQNRMYKMLMRTTEATTTKHRRTLLEYVELADDYDCMASTAKDLKLFRDKLLVG